MSDQQSPQSQVLAFEFIKLPISLAVNGANNEVIRDAKGEELATFWNIAHEGKDTEAADEEQDRFRQGLVDAFNTRAKPQPTQEAPEKLYSFTFGVLSRRRLAFKPEEYGPMKEARAALDAARLAVSPRDAKAGELEASSFDAEALKTEMGIVREEAVDLQAQRDAALAEAEKLRATLEKATAKLEQMRVAALSDVAFFNSPNIKEAMQARAAGLADFLVELTALQNANKTEGVEG